MGAKKISIAVCRWTPVTFFFNLYLMLYLMFNLFFVGHFIFSSQPPPQPRSGYATAGCAGLGSLELGLVETIVVDANPTTKYSMQLFDFLFVLDFEATCWDKTETHRGLPEIIEFSVVLYSIRLNKIVEEFQQYVMPMEFPKLSEFCQNLTRITQQQVDSGVPLGTCLMLFSKWVKEQIKKYDIIFPNSVKDPHMKKGAFVTWTDWDLNICLQNECKRKRINKSELFNMWIDLKALYRECYHRKPKGLNGALTEVGLNFSGNEHCGLHDARNTAFLAGRMISDGMLLRITRDISPHGNVVTI